MLAGCIMVDSMTARRFLDTYSYRMSDEYKQKQEVEQEAASVKSA